MQSIIGINLVRLFYTEISQNFRTDETFPNLCSLILFSSVADNNSNNPWRDNPPPDWVLLLAGVFITICVGYSMEKAIINTCNYFYPEKKDSDSKLDDSDKTNQVVEEGEEEEELDEIEKMVMAVELADKKRTEEARIAEEFTRQLRRFSDGGGKHPFSDLF